MEQDFSHQQYHLPVEIHFHRGGIGLLTNFNYDRAMDSTFVQQNQPLLVSGLQVMRIWISTYALPIHFYPPPSALMSSHCKHSARNPAFQHICPSSRMTCEMERPLQGTTLQMLTFAEVLINNPCNKHQRIDSRLTWPSNPAQQKTQLEVPTAYGIPGIWWQSRES